MATSENFENEEQSLNEQRLLGSVRPQLVTGDDSDRLRHFRVSPMSAMSSSAPIARIWALPSMFIRVTSIGSCELERISKPGW